jgi:GNAT superfamily N-acetyltransferase
MQRSIPLYPPLYALRRRLLEDGPRAALLHLARRVRAQVHERDRHLVVVKDLREIAEPRRRCPLELEPVERRHLPALRALNRERHDLTGDARFAGDLDSGYGGFVARVDDELIGFYWWADAGMPPHRELSAVALGVELGPGDVYGTDFYVAERHRAGGTANELLYRVETALRERGFERLWGTVEIGNRPARWAYATRGYQERWAVVGRRLLRRWSYRTERLELEGRVQR